MSFHPKTIHPHELKQPFVFGVDHIGGHDGVLVFPITLDLFDTKQSSPLLNFQGRRDDSSKSKQKRGLDNQHYYYYNQEKMNRNNGNNNSNVPKLDLKLNLSPPSSTMITQTPASAAPPMASESSPTRSSASVSPPSSCLSSELSSPEACSMVLVGCPRCLMYVMLSEDDPKCPKCKSTVLLDFLHDDNNNINNKNSGCSKKSRKC